MNSSHKKTQRDAPITVSADKAAKVFPAVRYFQIHFEFLQEQLQLIIRNQQALQQQVQQLESRLFESEQAIHLDLTAMSSFERQSASHNAAQNSNAPNFKLTEGR